MLDLIDQIRTQPEMDPLLRIALLRKVLEAAVEGSEPLRATLEVFKNRVDQADVDVNVPWMDPENKDADRMRTKAVGLVRSLPDLAPVRKEGISRRAQIERQVAHRPQTVGWLAREVNGWQVRTGSVLPPHGGLWVAMAEGDSHGAWRQVGVIDQAHPRLSVADDPALAEGRPVFVMSLDSDAW
jgi:hypothetical protein